MGVLDKFLDIMKLSDEDYEDDDFFDDYEEEYEEKPKKSIRKKEPQYSEPDDIEEEPKVTAPKKEKKQARSNVTPMRQSSHRGNMEVCVIRPTNYEDSREITETLLSGRTVVLNLEGLDLEIAQRIIDFTSGAAFAIDGNLQKVSNYIFLLTPTNIDISGDLQDVLSSSFNSSMDSSNRFRGI
jgi:cell division inhibitor SepF